MTSTYALRTHTTYSTPTSWPSCCAYYHHKKSPRCPWRQLWRLCATQLSVFLHTSSSLLLHVNTLLLLLLFLYAKQLHQ